MARDKDLVLSSCHPRYFDPPYVWVKENLAKLQEDYGPLLSIDLNFVYHEASGEKADHHTGLLADHFNHEIHVVNWWLGSSDIKAYKLIDDPSGDRYEVAGIRSKDDVSMRFSGTRRSANKVYPEYALLRFEQAELRLDAFYGQASIYQYPNSYVEDDADMHAEEHSGDVRKTTFQSGISQISCGCTNYRGRFAALNASVIRAARGKGSNYLSEYDLWTNTVAGAELTERGSIIQ